MLCGHLGEGRADLIGFLLPVLEFDAGAGSAGDFDDWKTCHAFFEFAIGDETGVVFHTRLCCANEAVAFAAFDGAL